MAEFLYTIKNKWLSVTISSLGAEMQSIKDGDGTEYLWQGNPKYWANKAMNLFPYIGRLTQGMYLLNGCSYQMGIHGFVWTSAMIAENVTSQSITFCLCDNPETRKQYPYSFEYRVHYKLENNSVIITYEIQNTDKNIMYLGVGGHPGFNVPLEKGLDFTDYYLEFSQEHIPKRVGMSSACFVINKDIPVQLIEGTRLQLTHELFRNDAIRFAAGR